MNRRIFPAVLVTFLLATGVANASWYDDYEAGIAAVRAGNWNVVVQKMSAAIKGNGSENNKARTYGMNFVNYHPYYYRGVANLNLGKYEQAIADLEKTSGPGPENLGSIDTLMDRAKKQLAAASQPEPEPVRPAPTVTAAPVPVAPAIDSALRQRASAALANAKQKLQSAQQRRAAGSPQYSQAMSIFTDATTRNAGARNNDDLNTVITMAGNAGDLADLAMPPNVPAPVTPTPTITPSPIVPRPAATTTVVMEDYVDEVRLALEYYYAGEFEEASRGFESLTQKMPSNGWIWAFLGASQYSLYAFEADEAYKNAALKSFQKAKQLRSWKDGLPSKYFSKRIQKAFRDTSS
jgi:tetratricopeptide (TPR) repeat protein